MKLHSLTVKYARLLSACLFLSLSALPAKSSGGGGDHGGAAGPSPMQFTVNIGPFGRDTPTGAGILQVTLVLHVTKPEVQQQIELFKPMVTHHIHLTINGFTVKELRAPDGKDMLADAIIERVNKTLKLDEKSGVDDVFFTSFILQSN